MAQTQFDATAPYQAPELPKVQDAQPSPLPPPSSQGFSVAPSKAGGIASIADNIMRGFMQGRAAAQESKAKKQANTTNALQASYNLAAQNLHKIVESNNLTQDQLQTIMKGGVPQGVDQATIDSLKQANQAVQGSWQAWTTWLGQHVEQEPGTGKKGTKGKNKGENLPFLQRLSQGISGKDPAEVSKAIYDFYVKNGPPIYSSLASVTANAKQRADAVKAEGVQTSAATAQAQETVDVDKLKSRERELMMNPSRTPEEDSELTSVRSTLEESGTQKGSWKPVNGTINGKPIELMYDAYRNRWQHPSGEPATQEELDSFTPAPKSGHPVRAWSKDGQGYYSVLLDPNTNQPLPGTENHALQPPSSIAGSVGESEMRWVDESGVLHTSPIHTEHRVASGPASAVSSTAAPNVTPPKPKGESKPKTDQPSGTRDIGYTGSKQYKDLETEASKANIAYNGATSALEMVKKAEKAAKKGDGPAQVAVVASFVKGVIGGAGSGVRVTQTEWNQAVQTAPILQRIGAHFTGEGVYGVDVKTLSPQQIDSMIVQLASKQKTNKDELSRVNDQLKQQKKNDTGKTDKTPSSEFDWDSHPVVQ